MNTLAGEITPLFSFFDPWQSKEVLRKSLILSPFVKMENIVVYPFTLRIDIFSVNYISILELYVLGELGPVSRRFKVSNNF